MKTIMYLFQKRNPAPFLMMLSLLFSNFVSMAQAPAPVFARVIMQKVPAGKEQEFEKFMKETMKPIHQLRRQKGKIINWYLFKVHFTGANDEYNYVAVNYYNSWANTEPNDKWSDLIKEASPKADVAAIEAKMRELRTIVRQAIYYRTEVVEPKTPVPFKYIRPDYMKVKPGMNAEYLKAEREDWKPFHQTLADGGQAAGWGLWQQIFPSGASTTHDYVTSNRYSNYTQIREIDYEKTFKQASPAKDIQAIFDRTSKSRDLVKSELWEMIDGLN